MRLLLVEDEDSIRSAMARGLAHAGHQVDTAASLAEAKACAAKQKPEALISDLKLPDGHGLDLARELAVPFVLMSGYANFDEAVIALRLGCVDFFTKPVSIKEVRRAVERLAARADRGVVLVDCGSGSDHGLVVEGVNGIERKALTTAAAQWIDQAEAKTRYTELLTLTPAPAPHLAHRQVLAELMQSATAGRVVVNVLPDRWVAWLSGTVDWAQADDRRRLIAELSTRARWQPDGALIEVGHA